LHWHSQSKLPAGYPGLLLLNDFLRPEIVLQILPFRPAFLLPDRISQPLDLFLGKPLSQYGAQP
jgi:hypothetical protein